MIVPLFFVTTMTTLGLTKTSSEYFLIMVATTVIHTRLGLVTSD